MSLLFPCSFPPSSPLLRSNSGLSVAGTQPIEAKRTGRKWATLSQMAFAQYGSIRLTNVRTWQSPGAMSPSPSILLSIFSFLLFPSSFSGSPLSFVLLYWLFSFLFPFLSLGVTTGISSLTPRPNPPFHSFQFLSLSYT